MTYQLQMMQCKPQIIM